MQNWTNIYYTLHSSILNRILDIDIDLNKIMPQAITLYYVSMKKKKKENYIHTLFRIIFKRDRIESQKIKLYILHESYRIKYYRKNSCYNRIKYTILYGIELHKLHRLNRIE